MKIRPQSLVVILCFLAVLPETAVTEDNTVRFPILSECRAMTSGPKEHLFASYYGITSWDATQRYATVLETDIQDRLPTENDPATLGLVDMETMAFIPLTQTRAWNFQQGCMAHWLGTAPDRLIIFNDFRDSVFVSVIMDIHTRQEVKTIPYPISAVSPNGKEAISINFARLRKTRTDYGYGGEGQDSRLSEPFPNDDGLFLVNLETGKAKLLVSIQQVKNLVPRVPASGIEYFNHTLFSRDGSKIFWLARATPQRNTTSFTVRRCFPDGWGGSHFDWLDGDNLMITSAFKAKVYGHILFTVGQQNYRRLGNGLLDYDGHGTFSPDGRWMVTDTYPGGKLQEQKLYLMDMRTEAVLPLGRFVEPSKYTGYWRCDLHPRWSPKGDLIGFNSTYTGSRQVYFFKLTFPK
jgi:hypothetical protein